MLVRMGIIGWMIMAALPLAAADAGTDLHNLLAREWEARLQRDPVFASSLGDKRYQDRWADESLAAKERAHQEDEALMAALKAILPSELNAVDQVNYRLFERALADRMERYRLRWHLVPLNQRGGIQTAEQIADEIRFETVQDYRAWLARIDAFPVYMDQTIQLMRAGIEARLVHARIIMERIPAQIDAQIVADPADSRFFKPFREMPEQMPEQKQLCAAAKKSIGEKLVPAFRRFKTFFEQEYLPACYEKVGIWQVPDGKRMYAAFARQFTTTELTPQQIHEIGLSEVARIRDEMVAIIEQVGFEGDFAAFLNYLRTDPRFYYKTGEELLAAYRALSKRIDPTLVKIFDKMPRMPYGVEPIPENISPDTTTAYYRRPAADGSRAGTYFVNLYKPETRPKYEMEALSIHEAVPGHHFQIALAMELGALPNFRRYSSFTAFTEGWGLYSESLGEELGLYADPYSKFGQLTYEMWRAVRLVVDTGMHYLGWSREKAITFFSDNAAKSILDITNEIDRYIAWPGQALAYKIGELKIKELRKRANEELGAKFDIRAFHNEVLARGAVTLDVLEAAIDAWIADRKSSADGD